MATYIYFSLSKNAIYGTKVTIANRSEKILNLSEAIKILKDGDRLAIGGFAIYQRPMAIVREIIKQKKKNLTVVGVTNSIDCDMLVGAGAVNKIETSYLGFEKYGLARNIRKSSENGYLKITDYPELISYDRFRASQDNLSFWPAAGLDGTDIVRLNEKIKKFTCPITDKKLHALPAADPNVVIIHALASDIYGNIITPSFRTLPQSLDITLSRCCEKVIVTVEKFVSDNFLKKHSHLVEIPSHRITAVCLAPFGAHPTPMLGRYIDDSSHWQSYINASNNKNSFENYLQNYIYDTNNNGEYLDKIGGSQLASLLEVDTQK